MCGQSSLLRCISITHRQMSREAKEKKKVERVKRTYCTPGNFKRLPSLSRRRISGTEAEPRFGMPWLRGNGEHAD